MILLILVESNSGLNYVLDNSQKSRAKPDSNSHVIIEYKLYSRKGELLEKKDSLDNVFQLYVKDCSEPLAESICLLQINSTIKILIDGNSAQPLHGKGNKEKNYLAEITLIDFHQHFD